MPHPHKAKEHEAVTHAAKEGLSHEPALIEAGEPPTPPYRTDRQKKRYKRRVKKEYNKDMLQKGQSKPTYRIRPYTLQSNPTD